MSRQIKRDKRSKPKNNETEIIKTFEIKSSEYSKYKCTDQN